jgi:hypothetical protein
LRQKISHVFRFRLLRRDKRFAVGPSVLFALQYVRIKVRREEFSPRMFCFLYPALP